MIALNYIWNLEKVNNDIFKDRIGLRDIFMLE